MIRKGKNLPLESCKLCFDFWVWDVNLPSEQGSLLSADRHLMAFN